MVTAYIGLGSNLGDPRDAITSAIRTLSTLPESTVDARSSLYLSKPVGPPNQPDYVNAVVALGTTLSAHALLDHLQAIEHRHGRVRGERWGARTLDLDLLLYGETTLHDARLTLPHPEMHRRGFVLAPLVEIAPHRTIPGKGAVATLLANLDTRDLVVLRQTTDNSEVNIRP